MRKTQCQTAKDIVTLYRAELETTINQLRCRTLQDLRGLGIDDQDELLYAFQCGIARVRHCIVNCVRDEAVLATLIQILSARTLPSNVCILEMWRDTLVQLEAELEPRGWWISFVRRLRDPETIGVILQWVRVVATLWGKFTTSDTVLSLGGP